MAFYIKSQIIIKKIFTLHLKYHLPYLIEVSIKIHLFHFKLSYYFLCRLLIKTFESIIHCAKIVHWNLGFLVIFEPYTAQTYILEH